MRSEACIHFNNVTMKDSYLYLALYKLPVGFGRNCQKTAILDNTCLMGGGGGRTQSLRRTLVVIVRVFPDHKYVHSCDNAQGGNDGIW